MTQALVALVAALVGAMAALWTAQRQLRLKNVTEERAAWRTRVRAIACDLMAGGNDRAKRRAAAIDLQLSTNPFDPMDREIVDLCMRIAEADEPDPDDARRLSLRLQLLLKHDWERAKLEAGWSGPIGTALRRVLGKATRPGRPDYARFVDWRTRNPIDPDRRLPPI